MMLDSNPVKVINLVGAVLTIGMAIGGAFTGDYWKGDDWGTPLAATVFGFAFAVASLIFLLLIIWAYVLIGRLRRQCPVCQGKGRVRSGYNEIMEPVQSRCTKCDGEGLIW